jgi:hypothetical protein
MTIATIENMRLNQDKGVFAYSPTTGEEASADPSDYFWLPEGEPLVDEYDEPMILVTRHSVLTEV